MRLSLQFGNPLSEAARSSFIACHRHEEAEIIPVSVDESWGAEPYQAVAVGVLKGIGKLRRHQISKGLQNVGIALPPARVEVSKSVGEGRKPRHLVR